jgi:cutinase
VAGFVPDILTAEVADHVAALALFGNPSDRYLGAPVSTVSPWYGAKAIDLCAPGDPVCTGAMYTVPSHEDLSAPQHLSYSHSGMPTQAATFVTSHL